jgi:guanylate kinase
MTSRRGILVIVSSPSGAGKTTLTKKLLTEFDTLEFSVSHTTRKMRAGERDGVDYHFVDADRFASMVQQNEFAEYAEVHGNLYGTARAPVEKVLAEGRDVIFDVDYQGGQALSALWPDDSLKIFILPPDLDTLAQRLRNRATDAPDVIARRLDKALEELDHWDEYQFWIVNDDVARAYQVLRALYLLRRDGAPYDPALSAIAMEALMGNPQAHARRLVDARRSHVSHPT